MNLNSNVIRTVINDFVILCKIEKNIKNILNGLFTLTFLSISLLLYLNSTDLPVLTLTAIVIEIIVTLIKRKNDLL